jgi:hypothetical protein
VKATEHYLHLLSSQGLGQIGEFVERFAVDDLRVPQTQDENGCSISAVFVDSFDYFFDMLVEVEKTYRSYLT